MPPMLAIVARRQRGGINGIDPQIYGDGGIRAVACRSSGDRPVALTRAATAQDVSRPNPRSNDGDVRRLDAAMRSACRPDAAATGLRSEADTSELQSH